MRTINAKELRASLPRIVAAVRRGAEYTVLYRSRPSFRIVPIEPSGSPELPLGEDPLYGAGPLGSSMDGLSSTDHDRLLYGGG